MYWLTFPIIACNISIVCALMALRDKFRYTTLAILAVFVLMWLFLTNTLLTVVDEGNGPNIQVR